jgi:hypothetical protein
MFLVLWFGAPTVGFAAAKGRYFGWVVRALFASLILLASAGAAQTIHYVDLNSTSPVPPYTNWATAAKSIQDAVNAASPSGAIVLVTNGTYASGGALVAPLYGSNRVAVTKPLSVQSVNGPGVTVIQGDRSGTSNEVRCVYLTNGASLSGFTLTNGGSVSVLGFNGTGGGVWCGSSDAVVSNCVLVGNEAQTYGSGGYGGTYQNCMFLSNTLAAAVDQAILSNCILDGNRGWAANQSTLNQCVLSMNWYGAQDCALANCILSGNIVYRGFLTNCTITGTESGYIAVSGSTLVHCNVVGNSGFGVDNCQVYNSIVYYNFSGDVSPYNSSAFNYCCTTPLPTNGIGNISAEPLLADLSHISAVSPCRSAGNAAYTSVVDIDGEAWFDPPSIGCDEYHAGAITGPLTVAIGASATNVVTGFQLNLVSQISGHASSNQWDFADGTTSANRLFASHAWNAAGDYLVKFHAYNESNPDGVTAKLMIHVDAPSQDWQTVDDFVLGSGNAAGNGVATDAAGGVYVVGTAGGHALVRYSPDGGSTWSTRDDFAFYSSSNNVFNAVTVDNQGTVFVGGSSGEYPNEHWIVRRSTDQGLTWETVDDYWLPYIGPNPGTNGVVYSLSTDGQGRVYGFGPLIMTHCPCYNNWLVRGSSIGGTNWDTKLVHFSGYGSIASGTCAGEDVYVTGSTDGADDAGVGLILRSSDHGATWTPVFQGIHDYHRAITPDSAGNLYSAGFSSTSTSIVWLARQSAPGGTNWITLDSSSYEPSLNGLPVPGAYYPYPTSIAVDTAGNVCVTGELIENVVITDSGGTTYNSKQNWFTRQYAVATGRWSTTDFFSYSTNAAIAQGTSFAPSGVFTVGYATSDTGQQHWVVRKRATPTAVALAQALEKDVADLIGRSAIPRERARVLVSTLDKMVAEMDKGQSAVVCNTLGTFSKKVQQFVDQGILAQSDAESLINGTANLSLILGCPER